MDSLRGVGEVFTQAAEKLAEGVKQTLNKMVAPKVKQQANVEAQDTVVSTVSSRNLDTFKSDLEKYNYDIRQLGQMIEDLHKSRPKEKIPLMGGTSIPLDENQKRANQFIDAKISIITDRILVLSDAQVKKSI